MTTRTFLGIVVLVGALGGALAAQQPQPVPAPPSQPAAPDAQQPDLTFRAEVNYVEVDARVVDEKGQFIPGLTAKDFQVFEDGKPQQVSAFSLVNLPVERATRPLGDHDVLTADVFCRPCMLRDCPIDHRCMKRITVETVFDAVARRLRAGAGR